MRHDHSHDDDSSGDPLLALLAAERGALLDMAARVPEALRSERLVPDAWSVIEVLEHVARVDRGVGRMIGAASAGQFPAGGIADAASIDAPLSADMANRIRDRTLRLEAPDRVRPAGAMTGDAAIAMLAESRDGLIAAYREASPSTLDGVTWPHPYFGPMSLRAWVELSAHHDARHASQLQELADAAVARGMS